MTANPDIVQLRKLLFGENYDELLRIKEQFNDEDQYVAHVSKVISEALALRSQQDDTIKQILVPIVEHGFNDTIHKNPKRFADVLYPAMGPAIRKSIIQTLNDSLSNFNQMLEHSFSLRAMKWRFDAWRTGQDYAQLVMMKTLVYQVEQVFLIHREDGLLIQHQIAESIISKDPDMVSGMLTAIQDFINDSFTVGNDGDLSTLKLGEVTVLVEHGPYLVTAMVVRGTPPVELHNLLRDASENIHQQYAAECKDFKGDASVFSGVDELLLPCLVSQKQKKNKADRKRPPWFLYLVLLLSASLLSYWLWQHNQQKQELMASEQQAHSLLGQAKQLLEQEPGVMVLSSQKNDEGYTIKGLIDPLARKPETFVSSVTRQQLNLTFDFKPYLSMDEGILLNRSRHILQVPETVDTKLQDGELYVSGHSDIGWLRKVQQRWQLIPGLQGLNTEQLTTRDKLKEKQNRLKRQLQQAIQRLQSSYYSFEKGESEVNPEHTDVKKAATLMRNIIQHASALGKQVEITILGHSDSSGKAELNKKLEYQRARNMQSVLIKENVAASRLFAYSSKEFPGDVKTLSRNISYHVKVY